jgi:hypothetical protein
MLRYYDFERARVTLGRLPNATGAGPFIIAIAADGRQTGMFDFSNMPTDEFDDQFSAYLRMMEGTSNLWDTSFYQEATMRQQLRRWFREDAQPLTLAVATLLNLPQPAFADTN